MHGTSTLLVSDNFSQSEIFVKNLFQGSALPVTLGDPDPITIADVRALQQQIVLRPMAGETSTFVLYNIDRASVPAQNALLKTLEEPPSHAQLILTATDLSKVLPTIRSRCIIQDVRAEVGEGNRQSRLGLEAAQAVLEQVGGCSYSQLFALSEKYKEREAAVQLITDSIKVLHEQLSDAPSLALTRQLQALLQTKTWLEQNANVRLALEEGWLGMRSL